MLAAPTGLARTSFSLLALWVCFLLLFAFCFFFGVYVRFLPVGGFAFYFSAYQPFVTVLKIENCNLSLLALKGNHFCCFFLGCDKWVVFGGGRLLSEPQDGTWREGYLEKLIS